MRFNPGDKFINKSNGFGGVVKGVVYGPFGNDELEVEWDHLKGKTYKYNLYDIKDEWSHPSVSTTQVNPALTPSITFDDFKGEIFFDGIKISDGCVSSTHYVDGCVHNFKEYFGLSEAYKYCTKCDKKENI